MQQLLTGQTRLPGSVASGETKAWQLFEITLSKRVSSERVAV